MVWETAAEAAQEVLEKEAEGGVRVVVVEEKVLVVEEEEVEVGEVAAAQLAQETRRRRCHTYLPVVLYYHLYL